MVDDRDIVVVLGCDTENRDEDGAFFCRPKLINRKTNEVLEALDNNNPPMKVKVINGEAKVLKSGGATSRMIVRTLDEVEKLNY